MAHRLWALPLWLAFLAMTVAADENENVQDWLEKMNRAVRSQNYQGVFVYLHGAQLEAMRILHSVDGEQERERLVSLNGAAREVIRDRDSVTCIMPDSRQVSVDKRSPHNKFPSVLPMDLASLSRYYAFHFLGRDRVADRSVKVIGIIPKDNFRYGYRLFLDEATALPLKSDLMDDSGRPVAQIMFTSLQVGGHVELPETRAAEEHRGEGSHTAVNLGPEIFEDAQSPWRFGDLPDGFSLQARNQWTDGNGGAPVEHLVLSDGLASVSVHIESTEQGDEGLEGGSRVGAVNAWGGVVGGHQVTAVGEVPQKTVRLVVESLEQVAVD